MVTSLLAELPFPVLDLSYTISLLLNAIQLNSPVGLSVSLDTGRSDYKTGNLKMTSDRRRTFDYLISPRVIWHWNSPAASSNRSTLRTRQHGHRNT